VTIGPRSQCETCARFITPWERIGPEFGDGRPFCAAFPDGIPDRILRNGADHRRPYPGDHGLQWTPEPREEFPE
jgi:hypothetical protein